MYLSSSQGHGVSQQSCSPNILLCSLTLWTWASLLMWYLKKGSKDCNSTTSGLGFFLLREQLLLLAYCLLNLIHQRHLQSMFPLCVLILKWYLAILHTNLLRSQNYNSLSHMYIHLYFRERYMYCALMAGLCWITRNIISILHVFKKCT